MSFFRCRYNTCWRRVILTNFHRFKSANAPKSIISAFAPVAAAPVHGRKRNCQAFWALLTGADQEAIEKAGLQKDPSRQGPLHGGTGCRHQRPFAPMQFWQRQLFRPCVQGDHRIYASGIQAGCVTGTAALTGLSHIIPHAPLRRVRAVLCHRLPFRMCVHGITAGNLLCVIRSAVFWNEHDVRIPA